MKYFILKPVRFHIVSDCEYFKGKNRGKKQRKKKVFSFTYTILTQINRSAITTGDLTRFQAIPGSRAKK
jgi:hypothetical protein